MIRISKEKYIYLIQEHKKTRQGSECDNIKCMSCKECEKDYMKEYRKQKNNDKNN